MSRRDWSSRPPWRGYIASTWVESCLYLPARAAGSLFSNSCGVGQSYRRFEKRRRAISSACVSYKGAALTDQGRQGVAEGLIEAFEQAGADVHAQACQFLSAQHDPLAQDGQSSFSFLLDQLSIDQLGVGLKHGLTRSARLARALKHL